MGKIIFTREEAVRLFHDMRPDFFTREEVRSIPEDDIRTEMALALAEWKETELETGASAQAEPECGGMGTSAPEAVRFGYYQGSMDRLHEAVRRVEPDWVQWFDGKEKCYCGFIGEQIVSFCLETDLGVHEFGGKRASFAGPGCVGTVPEYRRRGIGARMVLNMTRILRKKGYDYSYIHDTGVADWYGRMGYQPLVRWSGSGFVEEPGPGKQT